MRLPRRVPWASLAELDELCAWIYTDVDDIQAKIAAINRLSAWRAITQLPHALEATLSLLVAIHQDNTAPSSTSRLSLRQSYATAIIRLVNGLVDPLQLGAYARSISSIATQLGLPLWLVELRHAATHEHLPSLEMLRDAARESMTWLFHNYFLPTLNPSTAQLTQEKPLRPLSPILKQYKNIMKITTRDASLKGQYKPVLVTLLRDLERWIAEAKVAAPDDFGDMEWDAGSEFLKEVEPKERWVLEKLCDGLLEKGSLVPLSKKKRAGSSEDFMPPTSSVLIWSTLLEHVQALHNQFFGVLGNFIITRLLTGYESEESPRDRSYDSCIIRWAYLIVQKIGEQDSEAGETAKTDLVMTLMQSLGHADQQQGKDNEIVFTLLEELCRDMTQLEDTLHALKSLSFVGSQSQGWNPDDIEVMNRRLEVLRSVTNQNPSIPEIAQGTTGVDQEAIFTDEEDFPPGWRLLGAHTGWKPCPIGVYQ